MQATQPAIGRIVVNRSLLRHVICVAVHSWQRVQRFDRHGGMTAILIDQASEYFRREIISNSSAHGSWIEGARATRCEICTNTTYANDDAAIPTIGAIHGDAYAIAAPTA